MSSILPRDRLRIFSKGNSETMHRDMYLQANGVESKGSVAIMRCVRLTLICNQLYLQSAERVQGVAGVHSRFIYCPNTTTSFRMHQYTLR